MYNISLLSSFHMELGKCNADELYKIIEKIRPEVIFEELSFATFPFIYADSYIPNTVEVKAIKKYLRNYPISHFPVDTYPVNETDLLSNAQVIWDNSNEYRELWNQNVLKIKQNGYSFLNSNDCIEILENISIVEEAVLTETNNLKLINEHKAEKELHNKRENEMLQNIYGYSKQYLYNTALFICGVEHRKPITQKIQEYERKENVKLNWSFYDGKIL